MDRKDNRITQLIFRILAYILVFPLVFVAFQFIPEVGLPFKLDRILIFIAIVLLAEFVLRKYKIVVLVLYAALVGFLTYGSISNGYGFEIAYKNYKGMVYGIFVAPEADTTPSNLRPFPYKIKYGEKIYKLLTFAGSGRDVADPWYTDKFDVTFADVDKGLDGFLKYLKDNGKI